MSFHSRLRAQRTTLQEYMNTLHKLVHNQLPETEGAAPVNPAPAQQLFLLVGSNKGLCGAFNDQLFSFVAESQDLQPSVPLVTLGQYATQYAKSIDLTPKKVFSSYTAQNFTTIAQEIIETAQKEHKEVITLFSNQPRSFFVQKPTKTLIMLPVPTPHGTNDKAAYVQLLLCKATLLQTLYESLLAEQAARFLSMDVAYRNAEDILTTTKLDYNKARQAYVTRELTELASSMNINLS